MLNYMMATERIPYQAMPPKNTRGSPGRLEITVGIFSVLLACAVGAIIIGKIYQRIKNKRLGRPSNYDSGVYPSIDSHNEKKYPH